MRSLLALISAVLLLAAGAVKESPASDAADRLAERLRDRIEAGEALSEIVACGDVVYCSCAVPTFYERRAFKPAWTDGNRPLPLAVDMVRLISLADREGLNPTDYHLRAIRESIEAASRYAPGLRPDLAALVDLELLLSDAFIVYGSHLLAGRVDPESIDPEWHANRREKDIPKVLEEAIESGDLDAAIGSLMPFLDEYERLKDALASFKATRERGGWPLIGGDKALEKGARGPEVAALRARLMASGDLADSSSGAPPAAGSAAGPPPHEAADFGAALAVSTENAASGAVPDSSAGTARQPAGPAPAAAMAGVFDEAVESAVKRFQRRHGLRADGVVGQATRSALNVPVEKRIEQIEINMERCRWLPKELGPRYVLINTAAFDLRIVEDGIARWTSRVIVGRDYRRTPVFSDEMTYIVFNPYWHVPPTIALKDILPSVRKDPTYLGRKGIKVIMGWGTETRETDPGTIDWSSVGTSGLKYRFRQDPGPENSLGQIKFMFPNKFHIYLHDTPAKELFEKPERAFSSGCIRVEKPLELAEYLLRGSPQWNRGRILDILKTSKELTVPMPEPIPVHLLYWTASVDEEGLVNFRQDVYQRDQRLRDALRELPPGPGTPRHRVHYSEY